MDNKMNCTSLITEALCEYISIIGRSFNTTCTWCGHNVNDSTRDQAIALMTSRPSSWDEKAGRGPAIDRSRLEGSLGDLIAITELIY